MSIPSMEQQEIVIGLLSSKEKGKECLKEFKEKRLTSREKGVYEPIKRSGIQIYHREEEKTKRDIYFEERLAGFRSPCCKVS